jgi:Bacterial PH domain
VARTLEPGQQEAAGEAPVKATPPGVSAQRHELPTEPLGGWRFAVRGQLRAMGRFLEGGEEVLGMVAGCVGWKDRLFVATDRRVLLVAKPLLRRAHFTEIPYERIRHIEAAPQAGRWECVLATGERETWNLMPAASGEQFVRLVAERSPARVAPIGPAISTACATTPGAAARLPLSLAGLAVIVLYLAGALPRDPALVAYGGLALALAVVDWRARTPVLQIAVSLAAEAAVGLFVFEIVPLGVGALLALAAIGADIGLRQRGKRASAPV